MTYQWFVDPNDGRNPNPTYPTNEFTSDLVNLSIFTFEQSFTQVAGRFDCV